MDPSPGNQSPSTAAAKGYQLPASIDVGHHGGKRVHQDTAAHWTCAAADPRRALRRGRLPGTGRSWLNFVRTRPRSGSAGSAGSKPVWRVAGRIGPRGTEAEHARAASVARLFVVADARGKSLGARLLEHARAWAADRGISLEPEVTAAERSSAVALYERTGWRRTVTRPADWTTPDGRAVFLHHYVLQG